MPKVSLPYQLGIDGETLAVKHLESLGIQIIETRWKAYSYELDIIAFDVETGEMVFVEVKTRASGSWGKPEDAVDRRKILRTVRAANAYLRLHHIDYPSRFDIFAIVMPKGKKPHVDYFKNAFYPPLG